MKMKYASMGTNVTGFSSSAMPKSQQRIVAGSTHTKEATAAVWSLRDIGTLTMEKASLSDLISSGFAPIFMPRSPMVPSQNGLDLWNGANQNVTVFCF